MERAFDSFEQVADVVDGDSRPQAAEIARIHPECRARPGGFLGRQSSAQGVIHDLLERQALSPRFGLQPRGDVFVEGQGRSHIMMLG